MNTKEKFKDFVKLHPELIKHVNDGNMSWQKFYEMYDMYGEEEKAWEGYLNQKKIQAASTFDLMGFLKGIDLDSLQEGVNSVQRVLGLLQDITPSSTPNKEVKKPRPLYKHFED